MLLQEWGTAKALPSRTFQEGGIIPSCINAYYA